MSSFALLLHGGSPVPGLSAVGVLLGLVIFIAVTALVLSRLEE